MIKAIEQEYNGYRTRSTLEARYMVFFDHIKVPYHYEYQGYDLDGVWYLPDFYIPKWKAYFEVKDASLTEEAKREEWIQALDKAWRLRDNTNHKVIVTFGGFGSQAGLMAVFMSGNLEISWIPDNIIYGYGRFGSCNGVDVLHLRTLSPEAFAADVPYIQQQFAEKPPEETSEIIENYKRWATSQYLIPLHSSVGFNFAMIREWIGTKVFAPFSDPLFGSYNAQFFNKFKPYTEAYNAAKQYRFENRGKAQ